MSGVSLGLPVVGARSSGSKRLKQYPFQYSVLDVLFPTHSLNIKLL